jgi:tetrahydromethanopterin S-methyltransferase subunit C
VKITLKRDTATPHLQRLQATSKSPRTAQTMLGAGAKAVQVEISNHLRKLQARGNEKGWPSQGFFAGKKGSVEKNVGIAARDANTVTVSIADPRFVHRIRGGIVRPKRVKMLAIPLTAEAYAAQGKGSLKQSMPGLQIVITKKGAYLAMPEGSVSHGRMRFLFKLVSSVTHRPHPEEAPDESALAAAGLAGMDLAAKRLLAA